MSGRCWARAGIHIQRPDLPRGLGSSVSLFHPGYASRSCGTWVALVSWPARRGWKVPACPEPGLAAAGRELSVPESGWACSVPAVAGPVCYREMAGGQQP